MNDLMSIHYTQWVIMALGAMFMLFGFVIVKYNLNRKSKRLNNKMPSGNIPAITLAIVGLVIVFYGYVTEPPKLSPKEMLIASKPLNLSGLLGGSSSTEDEGKTGFLSEVSSSAK